MIKLKIGINRTILIFKYEGEGPPISCFCTQRLISQVVGAVRRGGVAHEHVIVFFSIQLFLYRIFL